MQPAKRRGNLGLSHGSSGNGTSATPTAVVIAQLAYWFRTKTGCRHSSGRDHVVDRRCKREGGHHDRPPRWFGRPPSGDGAAAGASERSTRSNRVTGLRICFRVQRSESPNVRATINLVIGGSGLPAAPARRAANPPIWYKVAPIWPRNHGVGPTCAYCDSSKPAGGPNHVTTRTRHALDQVEVMKHVASIDRRRRARSRRACDARLTRSPERLTSQQCSTSSPPITSTITSP